MKVRLVEWPEAGCARHKWGLEILHTFLPTREVVSVRTCSMCGTTRVTKQRATPAFVTRATREQG